MRHPLLIKIAPDLSEYDKEDIAAVVTRQKVCCTCLQKTASEFINNNICRLDVMCLQNRLL